MPSTSQPLRVGIVGINPKQGWGRYSHVPAIQSLPDLKLAAVATRNETSARAAAESFAVAHWFADPLAMVRSDAVDLVCVSVNVPAHRAIVLAALAAGKHVYSEWPLGRNLEESQEMAATAARASVHPIAIQTLELEFELIVFRGSVAQRGIMNLQLASTGRNLNMDQRPDTEIGGRRNRLAHWDLDFFPVGADFSDEYRWGHFIFCDL